MDKKTCSNCGCEVDAKEQYCSKCGAVMNQPLRPKVVSPSQQFATRNVKVSNRLLTFLIVLTVIGLVLAVVLFIIAAITVDIGSAFTATISTIVSSVIQLAILSLLNDMYSTTFGNNRRMGKLNSAITSLEEEVATLKAELKRIESLISKD